MSLTTRTIAIDKLTLDPTNVRVHSETNLEAIKRSLEKFGQRKPIVVAPANDGSLVVVAGNGTLTAARQLGWTEIDIVQTPAGWDAEQIKAYAIADNRTAELAEWDNVKLSAALMDLDAVGWDLQDIGFQTIEPSSEPRDTDPLDFDGDDNIYTNKINIPQYEITGDKPEVPELYNTTKTDLLLNQIAAANIPNDIKQYLSAAAHRHTVINYRKAAEYYPHAPVEIQRLMEASALVIIDFEDAIRNGYVQLANALELLEEADRNEA